MLEYLRNRWLYFRRNIFQYLWGYLNVWFTFSIIWNLSLTSPLFGSWILPPCEIRFSEIHFFTINSIIKYSIESTFRVYYLKRRVKILFLSNFIGIIKIMYSMSHMTSDCILWKMRKVFWFNKMSLKIPSMSFFLIIMFKLSQYWR